jgi:hypothetical protein
MANVLRRHLAAAAFFLFAIPSVASEAMKVL